MQQAEYFLRHFAHLHLADLARDGHRKFICEVEILGNFEVRKMLCGMMSDISTSICSRQHRSITAAPATPTQCERTSAVLPQPRFRPLRVSSTIAHSHPCHHLLAVHVVRRADHVRLHHPRMSVKNFFDFARAAGTSEENKI
jgi:hypothetical protein